MHTRQYLRRGSVKRYSDHTSTVYTRGVGTQIHLSHGLVDCSHLDIRYLRYGIDGSDEQISQTVQTWTGSLVCALFPQALRANCWLLILLSDITAPSQRPSPPSTSVQVPTRRPNIRLERPGQTVPQIPHIILHLHHPRPLLVETCPVP